MIAVVVYVEVDSDNASNQEPGWQAKKKITLLDYTFTIRDIPWL